MFEHATRILPLLALAAATSSGGCLLTWDLYGTCVDWCTGSISVAEVGVGEDWNAVNPGDVECAEEGAYCGQPGVGFKPELDTEVYFGTCQDICELFSLDGEPMGCANACSYKHNTSYSAISRFSVEDERQAEGAYYGGVIFESSDAGSEAHYEYCHEEFRAVTRSDVQTEEIRCCCVSTRSKDYSDYVYAD